MAAVAVAAASSSVALKLSAPRNGVASSRTPALASFPRLSRTSVAGKRKLTVKATSPQVEEYKGKATELVDVAKSKVPGFLKLVGTVYTGWFAYRYLLFEASRKELSDKVADLISQIK
ncbi:unnamed protein product [Closterium sp. NIES-65]|nr:unnamed protein product [Closterium sp. NIES-65]